MLSKNVRWLLVGAVILSLALGACAPQPAAEEPEKVAVGEAEVTIPAAQEGKFNVGMVLIGPHDDGGWSQAHFEGLEYIAANVDNVHVAYIENV
ncbi:MAG TPA: BMP family ABC transporter substrate-binding protein, partial [Anaerolineae bacterium]|nr:BMP family ABC transporter substrate-binding protein [Anaerolineae bacterium]